MLLVLNLSSLFMVFAVGVISFSIGLLYKIALITKQRKRILRLEDEMLANHASILALEKKIAESGKDKNGLMHDFNLTSVKADVEVKAS